MHYMKMVEVGELPRGITIQAGDYLLIGTKDINSIIQEKEPA